MTKIISIDDMEIEFEKQNTESICKWCIYIRVRKKDKDQLIFMFKTNHKPQTRFTYNSGNIVKKSKKTLAEIFNDTMEDIEELKTIEKEINDEKD